MVMRGHKTETTGLLGLIQKKKGMWEGRKGHPRGCLNNQDERDRSLALLRGLLESLFDLLKEVEAAIDMGGGVLRISQPRMTGNYGVRWWKLTGRAKYLEPVVVRWAMQKNRVMTPKVAKILKARSEGAYRLNQAETQECLNILAGLIRQRAMIKKKIAGIAANLQMTQLGSVSFYINNEVARLSEIRGRTLQNLVDAGYEVEQELLAELFEKGR